MIHKGERNWTRPNGEKAYYINVEAAPSPDMEPSRKMRVFQDGWSEDVAHWSPGDRRLMTGAKRESHSHSDKMREMAMAMGPNISGHANPEPRIIWEPPLQDGKRAHLRKAYEGACHEALRREGCDFGILQQVYRRSKSADGSWTPYMDVYGGKRNDLENAKFMRLFEDGTSEWYPPGPPPRKNGKRKRPTGAKEEGASTQTPGSGGRSRKRPKKQESTSAQGPGGDVSGPLV